MSHSCGALRVFDQGEDSMPVFANAPSAAFIVEQGEGKPINVNGDEVIVKIASSDTGGAFAVFEGRTRPLHGPPLHLHRYQDEWWYILEGEYRFEVDGQEIYASAGATVFAPRGSRHTFQNIGSTLGRAIGTVVPGGLDVFFEEMDAASPGGAFPDPAKMLPIMAKHGLELLGPPLAARLVTTGAPCD
jgi:mannose-6-phosphate isomerase-like protein (cupin superfamily)